MRILFSETTTTTKQRFVSFRRKNSLCAVVLRKSCKFITLVIVILNSLERRTCVCLLSFAYKTCSSIHAAHNLKHSITYSRVHQLLLYSPLSICKALLCRRSMRCRVLTSFCHANAATRRRRDGAHNSPPPPPQQLMRSSKVKRLSSPVYYYLCACSFRGAEHGFGFCP